MTEKKKLPLVKRLSVRGKLLFGFGGIFMIVLISFIVAAWGISRMGEQVNLYSKYTYPLANSNLSTQRDMVSTQRYLLIALQEKSQKADVEPSLAAAEESANRYLASFDSFANNQRSNVNDDKIAEVKELMSEVGKAREAIVEQIRDTAVDSRKTAYEIYTNSYLPAFNAANEILDDFMVTGEAREAEQSAAASRTISQVWVMLILILVIAISVTVLSILVITKAILTPIKEIEGVYKEMSNGNLHVQPVYESSDELGGMANNIRMTNTKIMSYIEDISTKLTQLSQGDMRISVESDYIGDFAAIKQSLLDTSSSLNATLQLINVTAEQVNTGAEQVASGAQSIASGTTEQAATVEELSASAINIAQQAEQNAHNVRRATEYVEQAGKGVAESNHYMQRLNTAMGDIGESSQQISKITKLVEDIAFQTNILSLNAAVEAARAGNAGKGFAVVADEVRNLATKSAEAAKQTAELIQKSTSSVHEGEQLASETLKVLGNVSEKVHLADQVVREIEESSREQTDAIEQINHALVQVSSVVQTNAATAEESSASSEELAAQAHVLQKAVAKFKLTQDQIVYPVKDEDSTEQDEGTEIFTVNEGFDKY
ncbi:methyl-accepting chemotaxis protein [Scatolibacter rhodanostii]|uniref:methyl-accepting chemotaxis protein n=1 Tax=Scatolibacter rhodanostii TaxID=2014781 RepID=UPI000C079300|nr:methyl-accepting chemotaxis protein [Scatolibacter rhodanostii]